MLMGGGARPSITVRFPACAAIVIRIGGLQCCLMRSAPAAGFDASEIQSAQQPTDLAAPRGELRQLFVLRGQLLDSSLRLLQRIGEVS